MLLVTGNNPVSLRGAKQRGNLLSQLFRYNKILRYAQDDIVSSCDGWGDQ